MGEREHRRDMPAHVRRAVARAAREAAQASAATPAADPVRDHRGAERSRSAAQGPRDAADAAARISGSPVAAPALADQAPVAPCLSAPDHHGAAKVDLRPIIDPQTQSESDLGARTHAGLLPCVSKRTVAARVF